MKPDKENVQENQNVTPVSEEQKENVIKVSEEQKQKLLDLHKGKLESLLLPMDDDGEQYLEVLGIVPDRNIVGQHQRFIGSDPCKAQEILVKHCLKTSKEQVLADDGLFYAAYGMFVELIPIRQGKFGKV